MCLSTFTIHLIWSFGSKVAINILHYKDLAFELNHFSSLSQKKKFGLKMFTNFIKNLGGAKCYKPSKDSLEYSIFKGKINIKEIKGKIFTFINIEI